MLSFPLNQVETDEQPLTPTLKTLSIMPWRKQLQSEHQQRTAEHLWRRRSIVHGPQGRTVQVDGKQFLNFCGNDYLGLANHPALASAAIGEIESSGTGAGASHLVCGHMDQHHQLESELASFVQAEQAIVFSTGYMANLAIPATFLSEGDLILQDRLNHASLMDAGRYCKATMKRYHHGDHRAAEQNLTRSTAARKMVLTDGVFSMDGDVAPVKELASACQRHDALLVVDEAHGLGVLGETGGGSLDQACVEVAGNVLMMGTFGKALGSFGAFVAGDAIYIESLVQAARTYIYTTALPPAVIAATRAALQIVRDEPDRREQLLQNVQMFRAGLASSDLRLLNSSTPIQPILMPSSQAALQASDLLRDQGLWVVAIRPPTVPAGSARLRVSLSAAHTAADIETLLEVLSSPPMKKLMDAAR